MTRASRFAVLTMLLAAVLLAAVVVPASARLSGAVWTTTVDGDKVDANHYDQKCPPGTPPGNGYTTPPPLVPYLNGGPNFMHGSWLPDGLYYFQVTDPPGKVSLSDAGGDVIGNRLFEIDTIDGAKTIIYPVPGYDYSYVHHTGVDKYTGLTTICLWGPYDDTPNNGGVYKLWVTPVANYVAPGEEGYDKTKCGFIPAYSKTDNFKVRQVLLAGVEGRKVDGEGDGVPGLHIILDMEVGKGSNAHWEPIADTVTGPDGYYSFANLDIGKYRVREDLAGTEVVPGSDLDPSDIIDYSGWISLGPTAISFSITKGDLGRVFKGVPIPGVIKHLDWFVNEPPYPPLAALRGVKFFDADQDGQLDLDPSEFPLADWVITLEERVTDDVWQQALDHDGNLVDPQQTGALGTYNFGNLDMDKVFRICEYKWEDTDEDGVYDPGEPLIKPADAGWLQTAPNTSDDPVQLWPPEDTIVVTPDTAPVTIYAQGGQYIADLGDSGDALTEVANMDFGNALASLCVQKVQEGTDLPLEGWEFTLYEADGITMVTEDALGNPLVNPAYTGADGCVSWANLLAGTYVVKETDVPGWRPYDPASGEATVTLDPGEVCTPECPKVVFSNWASCVGHTPGFWRNWDVGQPGINHPSPEEYFMLLEGTIADISDDLSTRIAAANDILDKWDNSPGDEIGHLAAFILANQLTLNLTQHPELPYSSGSSLVPECVLPGVEHNLGWWLDAALALYYDPNNTDPAWLEANRAWITQVAGVLDAFCNANYW